jgi:hypothetical protein
MKKLLGIVVLGLLWCNISFTAELIKIPVYVHIVDLSNVGVTTKISETDIRKDFEGANEIWSQADIFWEIKSIKKIKTNYKKKYKLAKKSLTKTVVSHRIKGNNKKYYKWYNKLLTFLLNTSNATEHKMHTNKINIYYLQEILPALSYSGSNYRVRGMNIKHQGFFGKMNMRLEKAAGFKNINSKTRLGVIFIEAEIDPDCTRSTSLAHELGHHFMFGHNHKFTHAAKKIGIDLMAAFCKSDTIEGKYLSESEIKESRSVYKKYFRSLLKYNY